MIRITVSRGADGRVRGISAHGHAGHGPRGEDIVCAAVSALLQTAARALEPRGAAVDIDAEQGRLDVKLERSPDGEESFLLDSILDGLAAIVTQYPSCLELRCALVAETGRRCSR